MIYPSRILWVHARRTHTQFMCLIDLEWYNHPTIKTRRHTSNTPHHTHNTDTLISHPTHQSNSHQTSMVTPTNPNLIYTNAYIYIPTTTIQYITAHPYMQPTQYMLKHPIPTTSSMQPHHLSTHITYAQTPPSKHPQCHGHPL